METGQEQRRHMGEDLRSHTRLEVVADYNANMGGVDMSDQYITKYNVFCKVKRWWLTFFFHSIDVAVVKSYILLQEWRQKNPQNA